MSTSNNASSFTNGIYRAGAIIFGWAFLDAFAELRKAAASLVRFVCPSVRMEQLGSNWHDFYDTWYLSIFRKSVPKIQISLKSDKNNRYFTWRPIYIFKSYFAHFFFE